MKKNIKVVKTISAPKFVSQFKNCLRCARRYEIIGHHEQAKFWYGRAEGFRNSVS